MKNFIHYLKQVKVFPEHQTEEQQYRMADQTSGYLTRQVARLHNIKGCIDKYLVTPTDDNYTRITNTWHQFGVTSPIQTPKLICIENQYLTCSRLVKLM